MTKDWKAGAAEQIRIELLQFFGEDPNLYHLTSMVERNIHVARIAAIIASHHERITKPEPGHVYDWAAKAGAYLHAEGVRLSSHRIAAVIAHFAEPLVTLLRESKREHEPDGEQEGCLKNTDEDEACDCGADAWNARVDAVLAGRNEQEDG